MHIGQTVLNCLESSNRRAELFSGTNVIERHLKRHGCNAAKLFCDKRSQALAKRKQR